MESVSKKFQRRKQGKRVPGYADVYSTDALGRIYTVHPSNDECFCLRLLIINVRGPTSFENIRTVDGVLCTTYREVCQRMQLLENDSQWDNALGDAILSAHPHQIRTLFSIIIATCFPSSPIDLWTKYKDEMSDDILHQMRVRTTNADLQMNETIHNEPLILIEDMCLMISSKSLSQLGMTAPNHPMHEAFNQEIQREQHYDRDALSQAVRTNVPLLNQQQTEVCLRHSDESREGCNWWHLLLRCARTPQV